MFFFVTKHIYLLQQNYNQTEPSFSQLHPKSIALVFYFLHTFLLIKNIQPHPIHITQKTISSRTISQIRHLFFFPNLLLDMSQTCYLTCPKYFTYSSSNPPPGLLPKSPFFFFDNSFLFCFFVLFFFFM